MNDPSSEARANRLARPEPLNGIHPVADWSWAQARVNFVIVGPRATSGWKVGESTVRGESPTHHSTVRCFVTDAKGRRLRCKEYYNDWWIPTVADISFRAAGRPIIVGDAVSFVGRDYRRHDAACGHKYGTSVEFSVEAGPMDTRDWIDLWGALEPLDGAALPEARAASFARRNYWNRWRRTHAPWDTSEISSLQWSDPTTEAMERAAWAVRADEWASLPGVVDSLGFRSGPFGDEVQAVFRSPMTLDCSAWLRVLREPAEPWSPLIDASEVNPPHWQDVEVAGVAVRRAAMDPAVGNWYYAWRSDARAYELHLRARHGLGAFQADNTVKGLLR